MITLLAICISSVLILIGLIADLGILMSFVWMIVSLPFIAIKALIKKGK